MHLHCGALETHVHEQDINSSTASGASRPSSSQLQALRAVASPLSWSHPFSIGLGNVRLSIQCSFPNSCLVTGTLTMLAHTVNTGRKLVHFNLCLFRAEPLVPVSVDIRLLTFWHHTVCK